MQFYQWCISKNLNSFYDLPYNLQQNLTVKTAFEIGNISTVIRLSNSVFNSFVNPVITTEEELVNITLSFDDWCICIKKCSKII